MRKTDKTVEEDANATASGFRIFEDDSARLDTLQFIISIAFLCGIILSLNLWFPGTRSFPRVPLIVALPDSFVTPVEYLLGSFLVAALAAVVLARHSIKYLIAVVVSLVLLVLLDQTRLQPWVYQYLLLFILLALHKRQKLDEHSMRLMLSVLQLIVATLYFWSGAQKLNYSFSRETLPQLLVPLQNFLSLTETQSATFGIVIALVEMFTGCGLLLRRTRKLCVYLALAMHGLILGLLIARVHNSVVWAWNAALMLTVVVLFWRSDVFPRQAFMSNRRGSNGFAHAARILAIACAVMPLLSFWGWWDKYLSGALYSGNTAVAVFRVDAKVYEKLPETAKKQVFTTKSGERMLPVFEWSMAELNVPPYPEPRVFKQLAHEICKFAEDENQIELIVKDSPAILDGRYKVTRRNCSRIDE